MFRRELAIAARSRATWLVAAAGALLVGHSFVLAIDLYSASSRSVLGGLLQSREMDPLAGVVRPTLGGADLTLSLLAPLVAARGLAVEKERGSFRPYCLQQCAIARVILAKWAAALAVTTLLLVPAAILLAVFAMLGGHLAGGEIAAAFGGEALRLLLVVSMSVAAACATSTLAQAATVGIGLSLSSWAIDAAEGFAALAWLGGAEGWSIENQLAPFGRGLVALGPIAWLLAASAGALSVACAAARFDWRPARRTMVAIAALLPAMMVMLAAAPLHRAHDVTELHRASLPPAAVTGLRAIAAEISIDVWLDRDDARRRQLRSDTLQKLLLARPDTRISFPLDDKTETMEAARDDDYGKISVRVGGVERTTRSTSRREIVTLLFEAAGKSPPDWTQEPYPGHPLVIGGTTRTAVAFWAYAGLPLLLLGAGLISTSRRTER